MSGTRQRWVLAVAVVLAGQLALIFALHTREPFKVRAAGMNGEDASGRFSPEESRLPALAATREEPAGTPLDPMVFAGAHARGFSGAAWLKQPENRFIITNRGGAPEFLDFEQPAPALTEAAATAAVNPPLPVWRTAAGREDPGRSIVMLEGDIAARTLASPLTPAIQSATDVLSNTVVQVAVDRAGFSQSIRVISGSGSRKADLEALELARTARFSRGAGAGEALAWGRLVFQWFTTAPGATNATGKL